MDSQTQHYILYALLVLLGFALGRIGRGQKPSEPRRSSSYTADPPSPPANGSLDESYLLAKLRDGGLIEAIKLYRQHYGCDLREAKRAVEALADRHGIRH